MPLKFNILSSKSSNKNSSSEPSQPSKIRDSSSTYSYDPKHETATSRATEAEMKAIKKGNSPYIHIHWTMGILTLTGQQPLIGEASEASYKYFSHGLGCGRLILGPAIDREDFEI